MKDRTDAGTVEVSRSATTDFAYQHPKYPVKMKTETAVTEYRGLTENAAQELATSLVTSSELKVLFLYAKDVEGKEGTSTNLDGEIVTVLSGSKTDVSSARADESRQWKVVATKTTYTPEYDGTAWADDGSSATGSVVSETRSASRTFVGIAYFPKWHEDFYGNRKVEGTSSQYVYQTEKTTSKTTRTATEPTVDSLLTLTDAAGMAVFGDKDYGQVTARSGTQIAVSATRLSQGRGWDVTTTTSVFTYDTKVAST